MRIRSAITVIWFSDPDNGSAIDHQYDTLSNDADLKMRNISNTCQIHIYLCSKGKTCGFFEKLNVLELFYKFVSYIIHVPLKILRRHWLLYNFLVYHRASEKGQPANQ